MPNLRLDDIVNVVVSTAAAATPRAAFNIGLIVGESKHIDKAVRCKAYKSLEEMTTDGFLTDDPEYKAAELYFQQEPTPPKLYVGMVDADSEETWDKAIEACLDVNSEWYGVYCASAEALETAKHQAVAAAVEKIRAVYFFDSDAEDDVDGQKDTDLFSVLMKLKSKNECGIHSATKYAGAALMGLALGLNTGEDASAFTLAYKTLNGVATDDLSKAQVDALKAKNANYYIRRGGTYDVLEPGVMIDGTWFDEHIGLDQIANDLQLACMNVLKQAKTKIPYSDAGALQFVLACNEVCSDALRRGFLAPGVWSGPSILDLNTGDTLGSGYRCQAEPVASRPASERKARVCPPIYICLLPEGAIHFVTIQLFVES